MTDKQIIRPPAELLHSDTAAPDASTVIAEIRSDASLPFDPSAAPNDLALSGDGFGAIIQWRVDVSWSQAQEIQQWLMGAPAGPALRPARELELKDFFENLQAGTPPEPFLEYIGTYIRTGVSNASYTLALGMHAPRTRDEYQAAFEEALNTVAGPPGGQPVGWPGELINFLKMMLNQPTSREEFLILASNVNDLAINAPSAIKRLIA
jgi:hypothetical protein